MVMHKPSDAHPSNMDRLMFLAAAALTGMLANPEQAGSHAEFAADAVDHAEAVLQELAARYPQA